MIIKTFKNFYYFTELKKTKKTDKCLDIYDLPSLNQNEVI